METEEIMNTTVNWTRYWSEDEKDEMRPILEDVFEEYVEFQNEEVQIGRTSTARGRKPRGRNQEYERKDKFYIQLNPESADRFTVAHELNHILTREKCIDLRTLQRNPEWLRDAGYLEIPDIVIENMDDRDVRWDVANMAGVCLDHRGEDKRPPAVRFEEMARKVAERIEEGYYDE